MAGYNDKLGCYFISAADGLKTRWPKFLPVKEERLVWLINLDGLTVGRAYTALDAKTVKDVLPGSIIVEPMEVVNEKALRMIRALARWEQDELDA